MEELQSIVDQLGEKEKELREILNRRAGVNRRFKVEVEEFEEVRNENNGYSPNRNNKKTVYSQEFDDLDIKTLVNVLNRGY